MDSGLFFHLEIEEKSISENKRNLRQHWVIYVTGSLDLEFHYFSLHQEIYYFSIILLLIFLRLGISGFDLASLCIA